MNCKSFGLSFRLVFSIALLFAAQATAAVFTITNTNDAGAGSLRKAIEDANATPATNTIDFNIGGGGVKKIAPLTVLPNIIRSVIIDGTTQPGWAVGNLVIELSGENLTGSTATGFRFSSISNSEPQSFIRGIAVNRFTGSGINPELSNNITIEGCFIGTGATGTIDLGNQRGFYLNASSNITIGGDTPAERNVISGNSQGIDTFGGSTINIIGNYLGTEKTGMTALANGTAIQMQSSFCSIGGTAAERNVI